MVGNKPGFVLKYSRFVSLFCFQQKIVAWTGTIWLKNKAAGVHLEGECLILTHLILLNFFHAATFCLLAFTLFLNTIYSDLQEHVPGDEK